MKDFNESDPKNMHIEEIAKAADSVKKDKDKEERYMRTMEQFEIDAREEGILIGEQKGKTDILTSLLKKGLLPIEVISKQFNMDADEISKLAIA